MFMQFKEKYQYQANLWIQHYSTTNILGRIIHRDCQITKILTKNIISKVSINWREKFIHKVNKPPCNIESDSYLK